METLASMFAQSGRLRATSGQPVDMVCGNIDNELSVGRFYAGLMRVTFVMRFSTSFPQRILPIPSPAESSVISAF